MPFSALFRRLLLAVAALLPLCRATASETTTNAPTIRTAAALAAAVFDAPALGLAFEIEATATFVDPPRIMFQDATGAMYADDKRNAAGDQTLRAGDRLRLSGTIILSKKLRIPVADCRKIVRLAPGAPPATREVSVADAASGRFDYRLVSVRGEVVDSFLDDIDQTYRHLVLSDGGASILVPVASSRSTNDFGLACIGRRAVATGPCNPALLGDHKTLGRGIEIRRPGDLRLTDDPPHDPFDVPDLNRLARRGTDALARLGRHRVVGVVAAVWNGVSGILQTGQGRIARVSFAEAPPPPVGSFVEVSGFPFSDSYALGLRRALWRARDGAPPADADAPPQKVRIREVLAGSESRREYNGRLYGRLVSLRGTVLTLPPANGDKRQFYLGDDGLAIPVAVDKLPPDALDRISVGSLVEVTGVYAIETEPRVPGVALPHVTNCLVVARRPEDLVVLKTPPWWTAGRLVAVIALLVCVLGGIVVWNLSLQRLSERRGREIAASDLARAEADLKTLERSRLAIELHDTISQHLTGVSLELKTADIVADSDAAALHRLLRLAIRMLDTCREDVRNCIWDLRNLMLDETDVNDAIRKTVAPHVGDARLVVRFQVPRERLSDNTTHAILRIVRELAVNAARHGRATEIRVAGSVEHDRLLFSVQDDGCGFDPAAAPGMAQGHFGLQGIRDRIRTFNGEMSISSRPGKGTKVVMALHVPESPEDRI